MLEGRCLSSYWHAGVSEKGRQQLINLKRRTGIQNWNVLCRWAFCLSLAESAVLPEEDIRADSSVEMTWRTFSGGRDEAYWALLLMRAHKDGIPRTPEALAEYFKLHLHRGLSYLNGKDIKSIGDLARLATATARPKKANATLRQ